VRAVSLYEEPSPYQSECQKGMRASKRYEMDEKKKDMELYPNDE
jgi:hypothetical protein